MRNLIRKLDYATVASTLAVFIALGGTSYAAVKITGASIKDNSVSGKDVRDRSLKATDFKAGALPAGPPGPQGPAGAQGESGSSEAVARFGPRTSLSASKKAVLSVPLPAGNWVVTAGGLIDNTSRTTTRAARCVIEAGGDQIGDSGVLFAEPNDGSSSTAESFSQSTVARTTSQRTLSMVCTGAAADVFVDRPHLTAVGVDTLNTEAGD